MDKSEKFNLNQCSSKDIRKFPLNVLNTSVQQSLWHQGQSVMQQFEKDFDQQVEELQNTTLPRISIDQDTSQHKSQLSIRSRKPIIKAEYNLIDTTLHNETDEQEENKYSTNLSLLNSTSPWRYHLTRQVLKPNSQFDLHIIQPNNRSSIKTFVPNYTCKLDLQSDTAIDIRASFDRIKQDKLRKFREKFLSQSAMSSQISKVSVSPDCTNEFNFRSEADWKVYTEQKPQFNKSQTPIKKSQRSHTFQKSLNAQSAQKPHIFTLHKPIDEQKEATILHKKRVEKLRLLTEAKQRQKDQVERVLQTKSLPEQQKELTDAFLKDFVNEKATPYKLLQFSQH